MNLIYMHTHDSGRCYQPYGYAAQTPHVMELARQSLQFNRAFSAAPTCSPSRAALLTGISPHENGMNGLAHRGFALRDTRQHLAAWLGGHGFETVLCGVQHEAAHDAQLPYERILPPDPAIRCKKQPAEYDLHSCAQVESYLRETHARPFFLSFGLRNTHRPYPAHTEDANRVAPLPGIPNTPETRADTADFHQALRVADECVGRVLRALRETGLERDTILLFTTDHGPAFPGMKCTLHDGGIGVTMLLMYPGNPRAGQASDQMVSHLDVFPTVCELLGVEKPAWLEGVSLLPLLQEEKPVREALFAEVTYHAAYEPMRCVRTQRYKLIRRFDWHDRVVPANIDASPCKQAMAEAGWLDGVRPREELYDLLLDPQERDNRVNDPALRAVYGEMSRRLWQWMRQTDDPLLTQAPCVEKPAGARVNTLDAPEADMDFWE